MFSTFCKRICLIILFSIFVPLDCSENRSLRWLRENQPLPVPAMAWGTIWVTGALHCRGSRRASLGHSTSGCYNSGINRRCERRQIWSFRGAGYTEQMLKVVLLRIVWLLCLVGFKTCSNMFKHFLNIWRSHIFQLALNHQPVVFSCFLSALSIASLQASSRLAWSAADEWRRLAEVRSELERWGPTPVERL